MKKFDIPEYYRSPIISKVRAKQKLKDPRKRDFSPTRIQFSNLTFIIARHFGFCYGVESAIEKSYSTIQENPGKRIFLLSEMIHNPGVNADLKSQGVQFIQNTDGSQIIPWEEITNDDIVIIPAFGTTLETLEVLDKKGIKTEQYDTTCPFVEKVWNRASKLGEHDHTIIIHGKAEHEETKATFSHTRQNAPSLIVRNIEETHFLAEYILGKHSKEQFLEFFVGKMSADFDPEQNLSKIGVVNQTTMLASETQEIADHLKNTMLNKYGESELKQHFADTRDTLCYATNDNQTATQELLKHEADLAIVVGGYNSSNTSHLVELLEPKFKTFFIKNSHEIHTENEIRGYNIHTKHVETYTSFLPKKEEIRIIITSGASCPDSMVDQVMQKILTLMNISSSANVID